MTPDSTPEHHKRPSLSTTPDAKDEFYKNLASTILSIPSLGQLDSWPSCLIRDLLFADDATHTQQKLQSLMNPSLKDFGLTISLKKTNVMGQDTPSPPAITINNYKLDSDHQFTYLGSTITDNLSLDTEFKKRVSKAATTLTRPTTHVWSNPKLTVKTKMAVYNACTLGTLHALYDRETWTTYARQEKRLNIFHLGRACRILGISWQDKVTRETKTCLVLAFPLCTPC